METPNESPEQGRMTDRKEPTMAVEVFWGAKIVQAAHEQDLKKVDVYAEHWAQHCDKAGDDSGAKILRNAVCGERGPMYALCETVPVRLTDEQRAAIQKRVDAATKGPWYGDCNGVATDLFPNMRNYAVALTNFPGQEFSLEEARANRDFIAHARQDIPDLVAAYDTLLSALATAEQQREEALQGRQHWEAMLKAGADRLATAERERDEARTELYSLNNEMRLEAARRMTDYTTARSERDDLAEETQELIAAVRVVLPNPPSLAKDQKEHIENQKIWAVISAIGAVEHHIEKRTLPMAPLRTESGGEEKTKPCPACSAPTVREPDGPDESWG